MSPRGGARRVPLSYRGMAGRELLVLAALLVGASLALLAIARSQGPTREVTDIVPFEEYGVFDYSSPLGQGIYDGDELRAPQPLFRRLGERLPLTYAYVARSSGPSDAIEDARGAYSLTAELRQANGWVRTLTIVPRTEFEGAAFETGGVIDVEALGEFIRRLERDTGYKAPQFSVRVRAHVEFSGLLRGEPLDRTLDQTLGFTLNEFELRLEREGTELERSERGELAFTTSVPRTLTVPLLGTTAEVARLPRFATWGLVAGALLAALVAMASALELALHPSRGGLPPIPARYRERVVEVAGEAQPPPGARVRLHELPALLRLAEQYQLPVLRAAGRERERYWVVADSVYVFEGAPGSARVTSSEVAATPADVEPRAALVSKAAVEEFDSPPLVEVSRVARASMWFGVAPGEGAPRRSARGSLGHAGLRSPSAPPLAVPPDLEPEAPSVVAKGTPARRYWGNGWTPDTDDEAAA